MIIHTSSNKFGTFISLSGDGTGVAYDVKFRCADIGIGNPGKRSGTESAVRYVGTVPSCIIASFSKAKLDLRCKVNIRANKAASICVIIPKNVAIEAPNHDAGKDTRS